MLCTLQAPLWISIHALRVEGDEEIELIKKWVKDFYPRPPGGGRRHTSLTSFMVLDFYPRPPGGGRPGKDIFLLVLSTLYFYPRPPGGGRQQKRTKFSSVFAQKGEEFASLRRGKRKFAGGVLKRTNFGF